MASYSYTVFLHPGITKILDDPKNKELVDFIKKHKDKINKLDDTTVLQMLTTKITQLDKLIQSKLQIANTLYTSFYQPLIQKRINQLNKIHETKNSDQNHYEPLDFFHFNTRIQFPLDVINQFPKIKEIHLKILKIDHLLRQDLLKLKANLSDLQFFYLRRTGQIGTLDAGAYSNIPRAFDNDIQSCQDQLNKLSNTGYYKEETIVKMNKTDKVNGYKLYDTCEQNIFEEDYFLQYKEIWMENTPMTMEEFIGQFEGCTEWSKQNRHGDSYTGFWEYPEGSYERENAWSLTQEDNLQGLYELPYPKKFILETVQIGCQNRLECVRYSNFLCEWFKRKLDLLELYSSDSEIEIVD